MERKKPIWVRTINFLSEATGYVSGFFIAIASLVILYQVIIRYFIGASTIWQTELSIYLLIFATFVGAAYGLKHDAHVGIDIVTEMLSAKARTILKIFTSIACLVFTVILAWRGFDMWYEAWVNGWRSSTVWGPPLSYPYFILPLGMTIVSLQFLVIIYEEIMKLKTGSYKEEEKKDGEIDLEKLIH